MTWICPECGDTYKTSEGRNQHVKTQHPSIARETDIGGRSNVIGYKNIIDEWRSTVSEVEKTV